MVRYTLGGAVRDISYDAADRVSSYTHRDLISGAVTPATSALNQSFAYDELSRLLQVSSTAGNWTYGYDANGNRVLASSPGAGTRVYTVAADSNRLLALSNPARSLSHDEAGNGTYDNENLGSKAWLAGYNPAGRMHYLNGYSAGWNNATYQSYYFNTCTTSKDRCWASTTFRRAQPSANTSGCKACPWP
jgi:YD repeat-containing protein